MKNTIYLFLAENQQTETLICIFNFSFLIFHLTSAKIHKFSEKQASIIKKFYFSLFIPQIKLLA